VKIDQRRGSRLLIGGLFALLAVFVFARMATGLYVDILWFDTVGYGDVFWKRAFWTWGVRGAGMLLVAAVVYANLKYVARTLGGIRIKRRLGDLEISEQLPKGYISMAVGTMSVLLGLWFGASIPRSIGLGVLFMTTGAEWGMVDPILGQDILFYMLVLPVVSAFVTFGMVLIFLCVSLSAAGYAATGALSWGKRSVKVETGPRKHLAILVSAFFALLAVRFFLQRYILLLAGSSSVEGIFGYTDAMAGLPGLRILAVLSAFAAIGALWSGLKGRALPFVTTFGGLIVGGLIAGQLYPAFVQRFQVEPNELARETPFIEHAIDFTKLGYDLQDVERRGFDYSQESEPDWAYAREQFEGLPTWNEDALITAFREIEARRRYYEFGGVTIDRYMGPDGPVPIALAVREIEASGIEDPNWQNLHLRDTYVAGLGAVASPANRKSAEGRPSFYLSDIPVQFDAEAGPPVSLEMERPGVFFGTLRSRMQPYVIVNPDAYPMAAGDPGEPGVEDLEDLLPIRIGVGFDLRGRRLE